MKKDKTGLEDFVGRHRADFDAFEPRPDLWDAIEQSLDAEEVADAAPLRILPLRPATSTPAAPGRRRRFAYGIAATLLVLLLAGVGVVWLKNDPQSGAWTSIGTATVAAVSEDEAAAVESNPFGLGSESVATAAGATPVQRTAAAVLRMETYYASQIKERQAELVQLDKQLGAGPDDWKREMATLDSTYQQLKVELARNPEPDVVLDAMNRNLQIRLDILNQQLRTRAQVQQYVEPVTK
ncbi:hypothetical protein [Hymenobacter persicinus]|uniref:Anti-sigma factor n=1 Tax=Hymenobacter persicinus TaxID=2025506 RepID=A0A4Q5LFY3_9BACT|nr:hypothetical protein [Hymenobacter persicinus]RYU84324.1 hypothetical protein EWM57_01120 [Hymenobacter persicinus]